MPASPFAGEGSTKPLGVAVLDFRLGIFRRRRSRHWLVLAVAAFVVVVAAALAFSFWLAGMFDDLLVPETLQLLVPAAAAITCWSRLRPLEVPAERHFE